MQRASEVVPSGLASVFTSRQSQLKLAMVAARKWCTDKLKLDVPVECEVANYLYAECRVIGGNREAIDFIELNKDEFKLKRIKRLEVSGAFHTKLMKPAEAEISKAIEKTRFSPPLIRFYSNYDATLSMTPARIRHNLIRQVSNSVKWEQILNTFYLDKNLPTSGDENKNSDVKPTDAQENESDEAKTTEKSDKKKSQSPERIYPDIYECGPASQTGPILRVINRKAHQFYKHIEV